MGAVGNPRTFNVAFIHKFILVFDSNYYYNFTQYKK